MNLFNSIYNSFSVFFYKKNKEKTELSKEKTTNNQTYILQVNSEFNFFPTSTTGQVIHHQGYSLSYSEPHEQAEWVAYSFHKKDLSRAKRKRPYFETDEKVKTKSAHWRSYKQSGYDRGHLCPAGDRRKTKDLYNETFLTSNISPQKHDFNSGIWQELEKEIRYWTKKYEHLYIVTGGILTDKNLKTIGKDKVAVPRRFYKILLDYTKPDIKAIAFLIPHKSSNRPLYEFVVSIDEIENITGIDFFPSLPDDLENKLESSNNYKKWHFR
ncbi:MAG: DNA/RNA non-specific endonuclease [Tenacibaculum sp.]|nr:DNA/RNA non-specific endonuclease [Tenacibaculum sp.]